MAAPTTRASVPTTIQNTATATSIAISAPTDMADDDVLYAFLSQASELFSTPSLSGWSVVSGQDVTHDGGRATILRKVIVDASGEPGTYTFTWTGGTRAIGAIVAVVGADTSTPEAATPTPSSGSSANPDPPASGTVSSADYLALVYSSIEGKSRTHTPPTNYTEESDIGNSGAGSQVLHASGSVASRELTSITAEDPGTFTASATDGWAAFTILVAAPPPPPTDEQWASTQVLGGLPPMRKPEMVAY